MDADTLFKLVIAVVGGLVGAVGSFFVTRRVQRSDRLLDAYATYAGAVEELIQVLAPVLINAEPEILTIGVSRREHIQSATAKTRVAAQRVTLLEREADRVELVRQCQNAAYACTSAICLAPSEGELGLPRNALRPTNVTLAGVRFGLHNLVERVRRDFSIRLLEDSLREALPESPTNEQILGFTAAPPKMLPPGR